VSVSTIETLAPKNILLIRLSALGDVLFTLPAFHAIKECFPGSRISYLVSNRCAALLEGFPGLDEIIVLDRTALRSGRPDAFWRNTVGLTWRIRRARFDLVIDFHGLGETAWLTRLSGAAERWGSLGKVTHRFGYTRIMLREFREHAVDLHLRFLRQCGLPETPVRNEFRLPEPRRRQAGTWFHEHSLGHNKPTIFIQPFTADPGKNWPLEKFLVFARHWRERGVQVIFGGGPGDLGRLADVAQAGFPVSAGIDLLGTAGVISLADVAVGGDTGIMHLAVALGRRVVMLMNSLHPGSPCPYAHPDWALVSPGGKVVLELEPAKVVRRAEAALSETRGAGFR
jgi:ADP-heptose:LPS heptosyltransferase